MAEQSLYQEVCESWGADIPGAPIRNFLTRWLGDVQRCTAPVDYTAPAKANLQVNYFSKNVKMFAHEMACLESTMALLGRVRQQVLQNGDKIGVVAAMKMMNETDHLLKKLREERKRPREEHRSQEQQLNQRQEEQEPEFDVVDFEGIEDGDGFVII